MLQQTFPVVAHGVRKGTVDEKRQDEAIAKIVEENKVLHPDLQIARV